MRSFFVAVVAVFALVGGVWAAGCGSDTTPSSGGPVDASADGALEDGSTNDATLPDGGITDGSTADGSTADGGACALLGGTYDKTCGTAADCSMVARGCYCGAQPIIGVAKTAQPAAQACESQAQAHCALGCANAPGHVAEDGQNDEGTGRNFEVLCDAGTCHTVLTP